MVTRTGDNVVRRGAIAGILAATAIGLWFLALDALAGRPFYTPAFLASTLLGRETVDVGFGLVAGYTILHYLLFIVLGIVLAALMDWLGLVPNILVGLILGFLLFDLMFYAGVAVIGVRVVRALGWPYVLVGNLIAGTFLMAYLHLTGPAPVKSWWAVLGEHRGIRTGVLAGIIGAAVAAVWFLIFDVAYGHVFFTPGALGSALFYGATELAQVRINATTVLGYTAVHGAIFLLAGVAASSLASAAEREPPLFLGLVLVFVTLATLMVGLVAILAGWILEVLAWWILLVGFVLAAAAMGIYLWWAHPRLRYELRRHGQELEEPDDHG